jgi:twitching motility protein PilT
MKLDDLLKHCVAHGASDIHLHAGMSPHMRVNGKMMSVAPGILPPQLTEGLVAQMCNERQREIFAQKNQVDFAYSIPSTGRFRVNLFRQRGSVSVVLRVINADTSVFAKVKLPGDTMEFFAHQKRGIVLVTGPTGSGKSTTLAAILDCINSTREEMIVTVEDPIEMLHPNKRSIVVQREIGQDAPSFAEALVAAMRQDPDVIMIGEIRDYATAQAAISAAQTGHLVFSTLHTMDTIRTINRIMELFPPEERAIARILFADALVGVVSQRLLPRADGQGRVAALEVLRGTLRVKDLIKDEDRTPELKDALLEGREVGMLAFDDHLAELCSDGVIDFDTGYSAATSPHEFKLRVQDGSANKSREPEPLAVATSRRDRHY